MEEVHTLRRLSKKRCSTKKTTIPDDPNTHQTSVSDIDAYMTGPSMKITNPTAQNTP